MTIGKAAQSVQRPSYPDGHDKCVSLATNVCNAEFWVEVRVYTIETSNEKTYGNSTAYVSLKTMLFQACR